MAGGLVTLPTYEECELAMAKGEATALQLFILNHEIAGEEGMIWRLQLIDALTETLKKYL